MKTSVIALLLMLISADSNAVRLKYALENFELEELRILATRNGEGCEWMAEIVDQDENIYRISVGDNIGRKVGKIIEIEQNKIHIEEIVQDNNGKWITRIVVLEATYYDAAYKRPESIQIEK